MKLLINKRKPNFLFSFTSFSNFGALINILTKTKSIVNIVFSAFVLPNEINVPIITTIDSIPIGMHELKAATNIATPNGASFTASVPIPTNESINANIYNIHVFLLKHFFSVCFIFVFLLNSTSSFRFSSKSLAIF